jgi:hypothetical protein
LIIFDHASTFAGVLSQLSGGTQLESTLLAPGTERSNSPRSRHTEVLRINSPSFIIEARKALFQLPDVLIDGGV